jgi:hypothetical protein
MRARCAYIYVLPETNFDLDGHLSACLENEMNSKLLPTLALLTGFASLPLYAADLNVPFLNHLVSPIGQVDTGTWIVFCAGIASLIVTRRFVR